MKKFLFIIMFLVCVALSGFVPSGDSQTGGSAGGGTGGGNPPFMLKRGASILQIDASGNADFFLPAGKATIWRNTCTGASVSASGQAKLCFDGTNFKYSANGAAYATLNSGGTVTGTGTTNALVKFTNGASGVIGNAAVTENGTALNATGLRVIATEYDSDVANGADNGTIRFAKTDFIAWRNQLNTANIILSLDSSNRVASSGGFAGALTGNVTGTASGNELPLTFSTGLTRTTNTVTVNNSQSIATLSNLTSNGFVKTSGGVGTLSIDTNTYLTSAFNQTIQDEGIDLTQRLTFNFAGAGVTCADSSTPPRTVCTIAGTTVGGSNTQVLYNNAGAIGGITGATTNGTTLTLVAPVLGAATATSINGLTVTSTTGTFTLTNAKTFSVTNSLTIAGTDGSTLNVGTGGTLGTNAFTSTAYAPIASPTFTGTVTIPTPFTLGAISVTSTGTQLNYLNAVTGTTGTASTNLVFSSLPSLTSPRIITNISDTNGNELFKVTATASAVNEFTVANAATGNAPVLSTSGDDTNIGMTLSPQGTGKFLVKSTGAANPLFEVQDSAAAVYFQLLTNTNSVLFLKNLGDLATSGGLWNIVAGSGRIIVGPSGSLEFRVSSGGSIDTQITREAAGEVRIGTSAANNSGILDAAGFRIANAATSGSFLRGNGTDFVSNTIQTTDLPSAISLTNAVFATGINNNGSGFKHGRVTTGSISAGSTALVTLTWGTAFADTNYTPVCQVIDSTTSSLSLSVVHIEAVNAANVQVRILNNAVGSITGTLVCTATHD